MGAFTESDHLPASRRQATEGRLLDALEVVLVRDGIRQLSLNAIVAEAGVAKPLVYRYFGNLAGLLSAWVERRGPQADSEDKLVAGPAPASDDRFLTTVAEQLVESAARLRAQPVLLEMLAEELTAKSDLSRAFARARRRQSKAFVRAMLRDARYGEPDVRGKIIIVYAALNYLAMRARRSPNFMGLRLDTEEGWEEAMGMVRNIVLDQQDA